jgi:alkyldihydroxyacetonephosphate synthase
MRRQKKFYAWGYADEDLTQDEIRPWEAEIAQRYGLNGFDVTPPPKPEEITLRAPRVSVPPALQSIVRTDHLTRLEHSYGKAGFDTLRMFMRSVPNPPDAVAFPENEPDIVKVLDWCDSIGATAIPYGGGSSVVKGIEPPAAAGKVVTISTRHMDKVLEVDAVSHAARIQGGIYGPAIEDQLRASPFTMRHYMQAYRCSTLGGWIATRSGGHYATLYTHIDDFVESMRVITPAGALETRRLPGSGAGPSPDRMFLGSEGILGIITEAWVRLRKKPAFRASASVRFKTFFDGADAVRDITQAGLYPANCRLLEAREALPGIPWSSEEAVLVLAFEGADHPLDAWMARALEICRDHGGVADPAGDDENAHRSGAAGAWRNKFIRAPHYGEHAAARGILSSTFETSMTWERVRDFHQKITAITRDTIKRVTGRDGTVTCRFTHVYPDGPCLYFTFGGILDKRIALEQFMEVLSTCTAAAVEHGGTTTHHHAVGRFHRPFYDKQRPELFARALRGAKRELDPKGMMNPGVLIDP